MPIDEKDIIRKVTGVLQSLNDDKDRVKKKNEQEQQVFVEATSQEIGRVIEPLVDKMSNQPDEITRVIKEGFNNIPPPEVIVPKIKIPKTTVNVKAPLSSELLTEMRGIRQAISEQREPFQIDKLKVSFTKPQPVILTDSDGKPMLGMFGGGGKGFAAGDVNIEQLGNNDIATDIGESNAGTMRVVHATDAAMSVVVNSFTGSVSTQAIDADGEYRDVFPISAGTTLDVKQVSGSVDSVVVNEIWGSVITTLLNADNRVQVSVEWIMLLLGLGAGTLVALRSLRSPLRIRGPLLLTLRAESDARASSNRRPRNDCCIHPYCG